MTTAIPDRSFLQVRNSVARVLLEHAGNANRLAKRDIAAMLGIDWSMVHRSIESLFNDGIIRVERNRIIIHKDLLPQAN